MWVWFDRNLFAAVLESIGAELEAESSQVENKAQDLGRRFQMGAPSDWTTMDDHIRIVFNHVVDFSLLLISFLSEPRFQSLL